MPDDFVLVTETDTSMTVNTRYGILRFTKRKTSFGGSDCVILPAHGDIRCACAQCSVSYIVKKFEDQGWALEEILEI